MSYLLDTNVVSEVRKDPRADAGVRLWLAGVHSWDLYVSVLTLGEVRRGIQKLRTKDSKQAHVIEQWLATLYYEFADRVIPVTIDIAEEWGRLGAERPIPTVDGLMAATASVKNMTMVTRNTRHFKDIGLTLSNPFAVGDADDF